MDTVWTWTDQQWQVTDKDAKIEIVNQHGKHYIKYPQVSKVKEDGTKEVHPAFIKDGVEVPYILREVKPLPYIPLVQNTTDRVSDWPWFTSREESTRVNMFGRGPCGMKRGNFGGNPYYVGITTQPGCMSDIRDCARCPANPNRIED